jgi:hypothetical protein
MNHASIGISLISLIPAMLLCAFVYYKDKAEKEPLGLLAILFAAGAFYRAHHLLHFASCHIFSLFKKSYRADSARRIYEKLDAGRASFFLRFFPKHYKILLFYSKYESRLLYPTRNILFVAVDKRLGML